MDKKLIVYNNYRCSNDGSEEKLDSDEFLNLLEHIAEYGMISFDSEIIKLSVYKNIPPSYKLIIESLEALCKVGGDTLEDGIKQLRYEYPKQMSAKNYTGTGIHGEGRNPIPIGIKRGYVEWVQTERKNYNNIPDTCSALEFSHELYKNYQTDLKKVNNSEREHERFFAIQTFRNKDNLEECEQGLYQFLMNQHIEEQELRNLKAKKMYQNKKG